MSDCAGLGWRISQRITCAFLFTAVAACSQTEPAALPKFEVASVKVSASANDRGVTGGPGSSDPGRYSFHSATLLDLITTACHVDYFQVSSKISLDRQRFDLDAKLPPGTTREEFRLMLRDLLIERFRMKARTETKEFPSYALVVAKSGVKLKESSTTSRGEDIRSDDGFPVLSPGRPGFSSTQTLSGNGFVVRARARQQSMARLVEFLHPPDDRPVVEKTGLAGKYDFTLEYFVPSPRAAANGVNDSPAPGSIPELFDALRQQLGLQLISMKQPFPIVVVEWIETVPTEN